MTTSIRRTPLCPSSAAPTAPTGTSAGARLTRRASPIEARNGDACASRSSSAVTARSSGCPSALTPPPMTTSSTSQVSTRIRTAAATAQANWSRISTARGVAGLGRGEQLLGRGPPVPAGPGGVERRARRVLLQAARAGRTCTAGRRGRASGARSPPRRPSSRGAAGPRAAGPRRGPCPARGTRGRARRRRRPRARRPSTVCAAPTTATVRSFSTRTAHPEPRGDAAPRAACAPRCRG